jgi:hypothetical protein
MRSRPQKQDECARQREECEDSEDANAAITANR